MEELESLKLIQKFVSVQNCDGQQTSYDVVRLYKLEKILIEFHTGVCCFKRYVT